jgi:hypothetical protein
MKTLKIEIPEGFQIENFDQSTGVIKFTPTPKDITERIKDFADVLSYHNILNDEFEKHCQNLSDDEIAYKQMKLIVSALNEGWVPDWQDSDQYKYYPWFDMNDSSSSGRFSFDYSGYQRSASGVGSRLCFKSRELCEYACRTFLDIYRKFFTI